MNKVNIKNIITALLITTAFVPLTQGMSYFNALRRATILTNHVVPAQDQSTQMPSFWAWKDRCDTAIPHFKQSGCSLGKQVNFAHKASTHAEFMHAVRAFIATQEQEFAASQWVDNQKFHVEKNGFLPFIQALTVNPGAEIIMFGDRHGDVRSTVEMMALLAQKGYLDQKDPFKITNPNVLIVGLGDYVDRGNAGVETIQTLLWFKHCNPGQVVLVRGNHEDYTLGVNQNQFQKEVAAKFGSALSQEDMSLVNSIYNYMPVAAFIGSGSQTKDFMVGCHGFIELGYHPEKLLDLTLAAPEKRSCFEAMNVSKRAEYSQKLDTQAREALAKLSASNPKFAAELTDIPFNNQRCPSYFNFNNPRCPFHLGWLWSYVIVDSGSKDIDYDTVSRTWQWGKGMTEAVLKLWSKPGKYSVSWIFRGHQHSHNHEYEKFPEIMNKLWENNGLYKAWSKGDSHSMIEPGAYTLMVAPDNNYAGFVDQSTYPGFNYDTWVVVKTASNAQQWSLSVLNKAMFALPEKSVVVDGKTITPQLPYTQQQPEKNKDNFYSVIPAKVYRSALLPSEKLETYSKQHGIKTIINLREPELTAKWYQDEVALCEKLGVKLISINFHPSTLPTAHQLATFFEVCNNGQAQPILMHCLKGADRTGLMSALLLLEQGGNLQQALGQLSVFFAHNARLFPHLQHAIAVWHELKQQHGTTAKALEQYDPAVIMKQVVMPKAKSSDLAGRV